MTEAEYGDFLAARILTENTPVTYRLLSRAVGTNVNVAKQMLFAFHQKQNAKKPNSIHATYLITGTKRSSPKANGVHHADREDVAMRSSPLRSSMPEPDIAIEEPVKKSHILLVREEELEKARAQFENVRTIHVYSLEPGPIENLNVLSTCNHEVLTEYPEKDPMSCWERYGSIRNQHVKRRTAKYAPPPTVTSTAKPAPSVATKSTLPVVTKQKDSSAPTQPSGTHGDTGSGRSTPQPASSTSTLKRSDSKAGAKKDKTAGNFFKSFAKAKPKLKEADKSAESTPAPPDDEPMQGMSEDEGDVEEEPAIKVDEEKNEAARKAREERAERLRKMMEDDDEEMPDAPTATESQSEATPAATADTPDVSEPGDSQPSVTVENGRRRGRRRVMKKKKVKDEDGYLVTKEEAVWESFSEEEPEPKKMKPAPVKPTSSVSSAKGKPAGKKGQGSIASFFKKA